jgi:hypothetical protein
MVDDSVCSIWREKLFDNIIEDVIVREDLESRLSSLHQDTEVKCLAIVQDLGEIMFLLARVRIVVFVCVNIDLLEIKVDRPCQIHDTSPHQL